MKYYTKDGTEVIFNPDESRHIAGGRQGSVYDYDSDSCIKLYYNDCQSRIDEKVYDIFCSIKPQNYCVIKELLYDENKQVASYIMKKYISDSVNILFKPTSYTLDNFYSIYQSINTLSNEGIAIFDMYWANAILGIDEITVIDFDKYEKQLPSYMTNPTEQYFYDKEKLRYLNMLKLFSYFKSIYKKSFEEIGYDTSSNDSVKHFLSNTFAMNNNPPLALKKRLEGVKIPIERLYY